MQSLSPIRLLDYVNVITGNPEVHTIYTSTNLVIFHKLTDVERNQLRTALNVRRKIKVLTISEISDTGWHQKRTCLTCTKHFKAAFGNTEIVIDYSNTKEEN